MREAMPLVPPGPAYRHAERDRQRWNPGDRIRGDRSDSIAAGQRAIVLQSLYPLIRRGFIEVRDVYGVEQIRDVRVKHTRESRMLAELEQQLKFWERTYRVLPQGDVRDAILGGDPVASIQKVLAEINEDDGQDESDDAEEAYDDTTPGSVQGEA